MDEVVEVLLRADAEVLGFERDARRDVDDCAGYVEELFDLHFRISGVFAALQEMRLTRPTP